MAKLKDKLYNRIIEGKLTLDENDDASSVGKEALSNSQYSAEPQQIIVGKDDNLGWSNVDEVVGEGIRQVYADDSDNEGKSLVVEDGQVVAKRMPSRFEVDDIKDLDSDFIDSLVLGDNLFQDEKHNYVLVTKDEDDSEMCIFASFNGAEINTVYYQLTDDGWEYDTDSIYDIYMIGLNNLRSDSVYNGRVLAVGSGGRITTITKPTTLVRHNITCSNGSFEIINTTTNNYTTFNTLINADKMIVRLSGGKPATMTWASSEIILMYLDYENSEVVLKSINLGSFVSDAVDYL